MISRADKGPVANWWWTVDRWLLAAILVLLIGGVILSFAASPAVATRLDLNPFHFVVRQAGFAFISFFVLIAASFLSPRWVRRGALILFTVAFVGIILTLLFGAEIKGARRWLTLAGLTIQPSEFIKPALIVMCSWAFAESLKRVEMPAQLVSFLLYGATASLLILQPDFGQTMLISLTWGALFVFAGISWWLVGGLVGLGIGGIVTAYFSIHHVQERINRFLDKSSGDTFQVDTAMEAITRGGWFGVGVGEGTVKRILPDSHTDFIFAVIAEEFGIVFCMALVALFAFIVLRALFHALHAEDPFLRLASGGLGVLFGLQALINIAVNVQLAPAKGMTLPFVSYGGSSLIAMAITLGLLLAVTRRQPRARAPIVHV